MTKYDRQLEYPVRRNAGFSLVELMVVLVILTIGLLPLALVQTRAQQDVFESGQFSEALHVAQMQMEEVKSQGFNNAASDSGMVDNVYSWRTNVNNIGTGLNRVTVQVSWNEKGQIRNVQVVDLMSFR
jgi:prepilin-type N-terminal cleavage/methylation domain-containing protein